MRHRAPAIAICCALVAAIPLFAIAAAQTVTQTGDLISTMTEGTLTISPLQAVLRTTPQFPTAGALMTVTLSVSHTGTVPVTNVLPGITITSGTTYVVPVDGPLPAGPVSIKPGEARSFMWTMSVTGVGSITLTASASGVMGPSSAPVAAIAKIIMGGHLRTQLTAVLSPNPMEVSGGEWFSLVMTVSNTGGVTVANVFPDLSIYAGAPLASLKVGPEPSEPVSLKPGEVQRFIFTYSANGSGTIAFSGTVTGKAHLEGPGWVARKAADTAATTRKLSKKAVKSGKRISEKLKLMIFPPAPPPPKEELFTSFEAPEDLNWTTDGYVEIDGSKQHATDGKLSLKATFLLPKDLTDTSTGEWLPTIRLRSPGRGTQREFTPRDWSKFTAIRVDCYNDSDSELELSIMFVDRRGYQYRALRRMAAASSTVIEIPMAEPREARLDLANFREFGLAVNGAGLSSRPVLYIDNIRFILPPPPVTLSATTSGFSATATGRAADKP